ncbi:Vitamin B12 import ATP-binding protein BtuD [Ralstonia syzygii subsp. syzygii]|nr:Vitamin B12 import ATP-binding protein BtuD [Ralstonia syzygii subsp. syzygii]
MSATDLTLQVRNLRTHFFTRDGVLPAVDDVSFSLERGRILGLVGESGSGKSVTGFSIMGLVDPPGRVAGGEILFQGRDLTGLPARELRKLQGNRIAMVFQDPMMTLNPVLRIEAQMIEAVRAHSGMRHAQAREHARDTLGLMGIPSPEERLRAYPHQLSGGMRQRVAIAIAMLHRPDLIIADEPTTALDVTIQAQILSEVQKLARQHGTALIWITHDLSVVAGLADEVAVMYAGRIVDAWPGGCRARHASASVHPGPDRQPAQREPARPAPAADSGHDAQPAGPAARLCLRGAVPARFRRVRGETRY